MTAYASTETASDQGSPDAGPRDDDGTGAGDESGSDSGGELVAVMDPEAGSRPVETPWDSGVETGDGSDVGEGSEGSEAPEPVVAEARVVMPRSSGAGSWLRWPSSSADRSDPSR